MLRSESIANLTASLAKFQAEVDNPKNTSVNPQFRSKYAPLDVVINTVRPILAKHGLSVIQSTGSEGESIIIKSMLLHESGEWIESDPLALPGYQLKGGGMKEFNAQGAGSAITYGRRYSLSAILGISSEDDDDANGQTVLPSATQSTSIKDKLSASKSASAPAVVGEIPETLKAKYQAFKGSVDGMEKWVGDQMAKGKTYPQMETTLQTGIDKKNQ
jgi:hypothetical protein